MTRFSILTRSLTLVFAAGLLGTAVGCGSSTPPTPEFSAKERQKMVKQDAEQILKERQKTTQPRAPR